MKSKLLIIIGGITAVAICVITITYMTSIYDPENSQSFLYDVNPESLVTRNIHISANIAMEKFPDKVCYDITDEQYKEFPTMLKQAMADSKKEILTPEQIVRYEKDYFFFEDTSYFNGGGGAIHAENALDFLDKYDSFKMTKKSTTQNIIHIDDAGYSFDCDVVYKNHQYRLSFRFDSLYTGDENFVILNITKNEFGIPTIQNPDITVYHTFNSTVLFANNLDHDITLSRQDNKGMRQGGLLLDEITIPSGQSWSHMLRIWYLDHDDGFGSTLSSIPFNYEIQPGNTLGKITVKNYPHCMTQNEVTSLYGQVGAYPAFPSYLPDGYSYQCGLHNLNSFVHMTYWTDEMRMEFDDKRNYGLSKEFFAAGGIAIDYYNNYIHNRWTEDPEYDKHENAKRDNADHNPHSKTISINGEPAILAKKFFFNHEVSKSYNELRIHLDEEIMYRIRSGLSEDQIIKIAESLFE